MKQVTLVLLFLLLSSVLVGAVSWKVASNYPVGQARTLTRVGAFGFFVGAFAFAVALVITLM